MKFILSLALSAFAVPVMAVSVTQVNCKTIEGRETVRILFDKSVNPAQPWTGFGYFGASLEVKVVNSRQSYKRSDVRMSPIKSYDDVDMRGDAQGFDGGALYLQLYPEIVNGQATGKFTGQLFVNDLDARAYYDFRSEGRTPGLVCVGQ
ncbi:hypothetical protein [Bdellovibrio sp. NC01]|uniref:hypothetical protein n=1 Tax=Bdellovibrio sp. NC01 TaxID=2220073 RepID=UPI00115B0E5F|nr:hypothetical protein [Bdellovibrio sp. NC01]QDK39485.1 hypothetical protein DOE51_18720 [Bdellovibrio sp. NC01]